MANIILRKFKEKDEKNLGRCIAHKMIPFCLILKCDCRTMYVLPWYDKNSHVAETALGLFVEFIRKNNTDVKKIQVCINNDDSDTRRVVLANGFVKNKEDEFSEEWEKELL